ncbi:hypothetical protein [Pseudactinotalea terrae]|uniref:hypothetical protein n=1 Tax=Pseudactinotalea terrae TaxID=1743262 RepID=UPI001391AD1F|nr:hypothetical protein [Pseudactinotalea terrae]
MWFSYLYGQLTRASLGNITSRIVIAGLKADGMTVTLAFYVEPPLQDDYREIAQIMEEFDDLTGNLLDVTVKVEQWDPAKVDRDVRWTYRSWLGEESLETESDGRIDQLKVRRI